MILSTGWGKMRGEGGSEGEGWGRWRRPVWGLLRFLAGTTWTTPKLQLFTTSIPSACPKGLGRSEGDTANNWERGVNPSHHCQQGHIRVTASLFTLLLHFPYSLFCGLYLTGGLQVSFITLLTPPHSSELYPRRCLWGGWQDVRPTRRSKSPLQVNVLLLTVTFSTPIGLTSQTHARLGLQ